MKRELWLSWMQRSAGRGGGVREVSRSSEEKRRAAVGRFHPFPEMLSTRVRYRSFTAGTASPSLRTFGTFNKCSCARPCVLCVSEFGSEGEILASDFLRDAQNPIWAEALLKLMLFVKPFPGAADSHA